MKNFLRSSTVSLLEGILTENAIASPSTRQYRVRLLSAVVLRSTEDNDGRRGVTIVGLRKGEKE